MVATKWNCRLVDKTATHSVCQLCKNTIWYLHLTRRETILGEEWKRSIEKLIFIPCYIYVYSFSFFARLVINQPNKSLLYVWFKCYSYKHRCTLLIIPLKICLFMAKAPPWKLILCLVYNVYKIVLMFLEHVLDWPGSGDNANVDSYSCNWMVVRSTLVVIENNYFLLSTTARQNNSKELNFNSGSTKILLKQPWDKFMKNLFDFNPVIVMSFVTK